MANERSLFYRKAAALTIPLIAYFFASIFQSQLWGNILSQVNALAASGILFCVFLRLRDHKLSRISMLLNSIACLAWGIADIAWAVLAFGGADPTENPVLWVLYSLTNLFLVLAFLVVAAMQFSRWNSVQMAADVIATALSCGAFLWIVFFNKDWVVFSQLMQMDFTSLASIAMDVLLAAGLFVWFLAVRTGSLPRYLLLMATGVNLFALTDLFYYYTDFKGLYMPNSLTDFFYSFSLYCIALGGLRKTCMYKEQQDLKKISNVGLHDKGAYLFVFPVMTLLLEGAHLIDARLAVMDYAFYAIVIFLHWSFSRYIQISIENERLLKIEKLSNETLEEKVTEQVEELVYLANQDTLTSLSNRRFFMSTLNESVRAIRPKETLALMMLDIDRFKTINDSFGHDAGDKVLIEFANRVAEWNRFGATIARLGGDEFGFIFSGNFTLEELSDFCRQITEICNAPITIGGNTIDITASIGVAVLASDASDGKTLMKNADIAMYQAKAQGYNKYQFFDSVFGEDTVNSSKIKLLLKQVDVEKEFELYYQPQFSLPDKELVGAEALIRWKSNGNGYIPPNAFIPVAEKIEYIAKIGKSLIDNTLSYNISGISIVRSIIGMSKSLGIMTIAEGVETEEQLDVLTGLGCDQVQGYLLGRPVPAKDFERLFMKWERSPGGVSRQA